MEAEKHTGEHFIWIYFQIEGEQTTDTFAFKGYVLISGLAQEMNARLQTS